MTINLRAALRARYAPPEWALLEEVRNATGFQRQTRTADAIAMSLWPSRGLELHGFELKVSRSDWMREKEEPAKAEELCRFCDRWWLVVSDEAIVQPGELPPTWGLLVPKGQKLVARVEAPKLEAQPVTRLFLASLLRNATEAATAKENREARVEERLKERLDEARRSWEASTNRQVQQAQHRADGLQRMIDSFERESGVKLDRWSGGNIGKAVRLFMDGGLQGIRRDLERMHRKLGDLHEGLGTVLRESEAPADAQQRTEAAP